MRSTLPAAPRPTVVRRAPARLLGAAAAAVALSASVSACAFLTGIPDVSRVELQAPVTIIAPGQAVQINGVPIGNSGQIITNPRRSIVYRSENDSIATVSPTGLVVGVSPGVTRIVGTSGGRSEALSFTVRPIPVRQVLITNRAPVVRLAPNIPFLLGAAVIDTNNINIVTTRPVTWSSLNPAVATINTVGAVTPVALGTARVVARVDTGLAPNVRPVADTVTLTVTVTPVASIRITPRDPQPVLYTGQTLAFTATVVDSLNQTVTDRRVIWRSADRGASLAVDSLTGVARAVTPAAGAIGLTATVQGVENSPNTTFLVDQVNVLVLAPAASTRVLAPNGVATTAIALRTGASQQLTFQALDAVNNVLGGRRFSATSDTPGVATVTAGGLVTAGSTAGAATLTVQTLDVAGNPQGTPTTVTVTVTP